MRRTVLYILLFSLVLGSAPLAYAQFGNVQVVSMTISPEYPRPYQTIVVTPDSTLIDMSSSIVKVSVNGKVVEQGSGVQNVPVTVGGPGEKTIISVSATTGGKTYTQSLTVRPSDVSLVIEPVSTTHPFYEGASLVASEGRVRVVAIPDLRTTAKTRIDPSSLVYTWKFGDQILQDQSGIGHSILNATAPVRYRDAQITVTVATSDSSIVAQASTLISPVDPILHFYKNDPLLGPLFDQALTDSYTMSSDEESFRGVAYYFGSTPALVWAVNGQASGADKDVTVRSTGAGSGVALLSLNAHDTSRNQSVAGSLRVLFGAKKGTNLFGF